MLLIEFILENLVRGVDEDDCEFLNEIDNIRLKREKQLRQEENNEVEQVKISF